MLPITTSHHVFRAWITAIGGKGRLSRHVVVHAVNSSQWPSGLITIPTRRLINIVNRVHSEITYCGAILAE